jgi:hypothetical protein
MRYHRLEADKISELDGLSRLKRMIAKHDWYFDYSDDHSVWQRRVNERKAIKALAKELGMEEVFEEAFDAVTNNNLKSFLKTL